MKTWKVGDSEWNNMVLDWTANRVFGALSWDENPVHFDDDRMEKTHFKKPIANGIQCISCIGAAIVKLFTTNDALVIALEQHNSFLKPVFVGESIKAEITIDTVQPNNTYWLQCFVKNANDEICISARFRVRVLEG